MTKIKEMVISFTAEMTRRGWVPPAPSEKVFEDFTAAMRAAIEAMQKPPGDVEVWRCPCCRQIVDRQTMAIAAREDEPT